MNIEDQYNLRPIWDATFEIYKEIAKICDRHSLRYYVTDGTLIGAVRHKGFIPWDDDFDMSMPRPDYERFIGYAKNELPSHLKFVNWENTPEFHLMFGKVQDCRREVVVSLENQCGCKLSNGVFVDIFPIDGYPVKKSDRFLIRAFDFILRQDINFRFIKWKDRSWKGRLLYPLGALIAFILPWLKTYSDFQRVYEKMLLKYPYDMSEYTGRASVCLHVINRPPLLKTTWGMGRKIDFHTSKVNIPDNFDAYLRPIYGDYMRLPPVESRHPSHSYSYRCAWWLGPTRDVQN